jgi:hypothetical protein
MELLEARNMPYKLFYGGHHNSDDGEANDIFANGLYKW